MIPDYVVVGCIYGTMNMFACVLNKWATKEDHIGEDVEAENLDIWLEQ